MLRNPAQVGRTLAELIQHELTDGLGRRLVPHAASGAAGPALSWHSRFSQLALQLIAITSNAGEQGYRPNAVMTFRPTDPAQGRNICSCPFSPGSRYWCGPGTAATI